MPKAEPDQAQDRPFSQDIENRFTYHNPAPDVIPDFARIRNEVKAIAYTIVQKVPPGREQSLALTKLEEAVMWANAGIARHG